MDGHIYERVAPPLTREEKEGHIYITLPSKGTFRPLRKPLNPLVNYSQGWKSYLRFFQEERQ